MAIRHGAIIWQSVAMAREAIDVSVEGKRSRKKRRWSDFTRGQQTAIVVGAAAEVVMTTFAVRDLARRPAAEVRGRKLPWALTFFVQPIGPVLYLLVGRRSSSR